MGFLFSVDEIKSGCYNPDMPEECAPYFPLLKYSVGGNNIEEGCVALAHRDFSTLERPGISYWGKSIFFAFGLEGVNSDTGFNTRADLLDSALAWAWDETEAIIEADVRPVGQVSYFTAMMDSTYGGDGTLFRWDFDDGTQTFCAAADTFIHAGLLTDNFGNWFFMSVGGNDIARSLLRFDLSSIAPVSG